jgi:hypothetical protein
MARVPELMHHASLTTYTHDATAPLVQKSATINLKITQDRVHTVTAKVEREPNKQAWRSTPFLIPCATRSSTWFSRCRRLRLPARYVLASSSSLASCCTEHSTAACSTHRRRHASSSRATTARAHACRQASQPASQQAARP